MNTRAPAPRPCDSCPYRRDVPSGVWSAEEYAKLPAYDLPTYEQPVGLFLCHQQSGRVCAGWCGTHDMAESLALRVAVRGVSAEVIEACLDYVSPVPLFASGAEASAHGLRDVGQPGRDAIETMSKIVRRRR